MSFAQAERALAASPAGSEPFDPAVTEGLPGPAARLLRHAIAPGTTLARGVRLELTGSVVQRGRRLTLTADEWLVPGVGFTWKARGAMGPAWVVVRDHYHRGRSAVDVRLLGLLPLGGEHDEHTVASSRGRLAGESVWVPSMLLPGPGVTWQEVDDARATVTLTVDGVSEEVTVTVEPGGTLTELTMQRWGSVGVQEPRRLPYGFRVLAERTFGGYTVPAQLAGGWWYGTDRFRPSEASRFTVTDAAYR